MALIYHRVSAGGADSRPRLAGILREVTLRALPSSSYFPAVCRRLVQVPLGLGACVLWSISVHADERRSAEEGEHLELRDTTQELGSAELEVLPLFTRYPRYLADPRRPRFGGAVGRTLGPSVPGASRSRIFLDLGVQRTFLELRPSSDSAHALQLDVQAGAFTQFDLIERLDSIGWDGWYGFHLSYDTGTPFLVKLGLRHLSAHLGDEYEEKTGGRRMNYTREDVSLALAYRLRDGSALYVEYGYAYHLGNPDVQRRQLLEYGVSHEADGLWLGGTTGYYAGLHVKHFQENGFEPDVAAQLGFLFRRGPGTLAMRFPAVEAYVGRAILGEMSQEREGYVSLGVWMDF